MQRQKLQLSPDVVWIYINESTLELGPFLFFGGAAGKPLSDISDLMVAKHTKGDAQGVKAERTDLRVIKKGQFKRYDSIEELYMILFDHG